MAFCNLQITFPCSRKQRMVFSLLFRYYVYESEKRGFKMRATDILEEEHQVILTSWIRWIVSSESPPPEIIRPVFFGRVGFHQELRRRLPSRQGGTRPLQIHGKTRRSVEGGPIGVMLADHEQGRQFNRAIKSAAEKWQAGDASAYDTVKTNAGVRGSAARSYRQGEQRALPDGQPRHPPRRANRDRGEI